MSICRALLRNTSNALTLRMSGEQIHLQVPPKLFEVNNWISQMIRQWIPDCWSGDRKCTGPKSAVTNSQNWQLIIWQIADAGDQKLQRLAHRGRRVPWSLVAKTTMDCHSKLVLHSLRNNQPVQLSADSGTTMAAACKSKPAKLK